ncbi:MAG TPA: hypothetical protein ACHBX0_03080 [Arsenophonus sp.]
MLQIKPGEILFFNTLGGNSVHMLVSLGNVLFSSKRNSQLCPYLKDSNSIIMAEQISQFVGDQFEGYGSSLGELKVYTAQSYGRRSPQNSLNNVVQQSLKKEETVSELPEFMTRILEDTEELSSEQAMIF